MNRDSEKFNLGDTLFQVQHHISKLAMKASDVPVESFIRTNMARELAAELVQKRMNKVETEEAYIFRMSVYVLTDDELDILINRRIRKMQRDYGLLRDIPPVFAAGDEL